MGTARQLEMERREESGGSSLQRVAARRIARAVARVERVARRVGGAAATAADAGERWRASRGRSSRRASGRGGGNWELLARVKSNAERGRDREIVRQRLALQEEVERLQSNLASCVEEARSERGRARGDTDA